jgi:hypothetical protein
MTIDVGWVLAPLFWMWVVLMFALFAFAVGWVTYTLVKKWRQR